MYGPTLNMKTNNHPNLDEIERELSSLPLSELRERFARCYGYTCKTKHRSHLIQRILWAVQRDAYGDISDAAREKAMAIADDRDVKQRFPRNTPTPVNQKTEKTLTVAYAPKIELLPGTVLHRNYQGEDIRVLVQEKGFEWNGEVYKSLSACARAVTGTRWNGKLFFGLVKGGAR